jgi:hypothetical protein
VEAAEECIGRTPAAKKVIDQSRQFVNNRAGEKSWEDAGNILFSLFWFYLH